MDEYSDGEVSLQSPWTRSFDVKLKLFCYIMNVTLLLISTTVKT